MPISLSERQRENALCDLRNVIEKLGPGIEQLELTTADIIGEWQGTKQISDEKTINWSKEQQYAVLEVDTKDTPVILYLHGGAYMVCSIDTHRPLTARLAEGCHGRVFSVQYRLAPQNPFPSALIDAICAYKYLIEPPPGALHKPVPPSKIVISGDSAGVLYPLSVK